MIIDNDFHVIFVFCDIVRMPTITDWHLIIGRGGVLLPTFSGVMLLAFDDLVTGLIV